MKIPPVFGSGKLPDIDEGVPFISTTPSSSTAAPTTVYELWTQWSQIIHDARPNTASVSIRGSASTERPPFAMKVRTPYRDLVRNPSSEIDAMQSAHKHFTKELDKLQDPPGIFHGQGVVVVGGGEYFGPAIIGIHMLRRSGSTLPVEVFVPDQKEYNPVLCEQYLPKLNASCKIMTDFTSHGGRGTAAMKISHYQYKALALLFSSFEEVLLLDSDSMALLAPETHLFNSEPYTSSGLVIWPDFWLASESPKFYTIAGLSSFPNNLPPTSSETGQLLLNKKTHFKTLLLATYYNMYGPDYYYPLLSQGALGQGDKETFMAAAAVLHAPYYRVQTPVAQLGRHNGAEEKGTAMIQHLPSDDLRKTSPLSSSKDAEMEVRPAFLHANTPKMNAGHLIDEGDLFNVDGKTRLRLLGTEKESVERFGIDLERAVWDLLVQTGCELADVVREWKGRKDMCKRLEEHYDAIFGHGT